MAVNTWIWCKCKASDRIWAPQLQGAPAALRDSWSLATSEGTHCCFMLYVWLWRSRRPAPRDILESGNGNDFQSKAKKQVRYLNSLPYLKRL